MKIDKVARTKLGVYTYQTTILRIIFVAFYLVMADNTTVVAKLERCLYPNLPRDILDFL